MHSLAPVDQLARLVLADLDRLDVTAPPAPEPGSMLTVAAVAERLGVSRYWVHRHGKAWPCYRRVGRSVRFDAAVFETALREGRITGGGRSGDPRGSI